MENSLTNHSHRKVLFIINPISGKARIADINEQIANYMDFTFFSVEGVFTEYKNHAYELAKQAVEDKVDYVIAVGGDGTVNEIASALINTKTVLGIVPNGSGNGLARHLKIPGNIDEAIELINLRTEKFIDSIEVNGKFFFNMAGLGFDAHIANEFGKDGVRGVKGYGRLIAKEYFRFKPSIYEIFTPEENISTSAFMVCLANGKQWGNGAVISPKSSVSDGMLDICIVSKIPTLALPITIYKLFNRSLGSTKYIKRIRTKNATIIQKNTIAHLDGEPVVIGNKLDIKVHPSSLKVLVKK